MRAFIGLLILTLIVGGTELFGQTDEVLVAKLSSRDPHTAHDAVSEVIVRGERMLPLIAEMKGDRREYLGRGLVSPSSSFLALGPKHDPTQLVTMEHLALYLLTAIHYPVHRFAQSPFLHDLSDPERRRSADQRLIDQAWTAANSWLTLEKDVGLEEMRRRRHAPLAGSGVTFYGTGGDIYLYPEPEPSEGKR